MQPIVLVLLFATCAFAAPSTVSVHLVPVQNAAVPYDSGNGVNSGIVAQAMELQDDADNPCYVVFIEKIIQDMADQPNSYIQAMALSQLLAVLGTIAYGVPGNACVAANVRDGSASHLLQGTLAEKLSSNQGAVARFNEVPFRSFQESLLAARLAGFHFLRIEAINQALTTGNGSSFISYLMNACDAITELSVNANNVRYSSPPSGTCSGNGRSYRFEDAWDIIFTAATPDNVALVNEEYCATKRLYNAPSARSNNIAAAVTAASMPSVVQTVARSATAILNFLRAALNGNGYAYANVAKSALAGK